MKKGIILTCAVMLMALLSPPLEGQQEPVRGITEPYRDVTLSVTVPGTVSRILKKEGDSVRAGEEVLELDKDLESLETERRRAVWQSDVELQEARARLASLTQILASTKELFTSTHSVSEDELRQKELEAGLAGLEVQRLSDQKQREEIEYKIAQAQLSRRTITAPFDGVIVKLFVDIGDECGPPQPVVRIVDVSRCRLVVHMDGAASRGFQQGMKVHVSLRGTGPSSIAQGTVDFVSPVVDASSGLREIKVLFDNPDGRLLPGTTGTLIGGQEGKMN